VICWHCQRRPQLTGAPVGRRVRTGEHQRIPANHTGHHCIDVDGRCQME
jgi:hypothetical protein